MTATVRNRVQSFIDRGEAGEWDKGVQELSKSSPHQPTDPLTPSHIPVPYGGFSGFLHHRRRRHRLRIATFNYVV